MTTRPRPGGVLDVGDGNRRGGEKREREEEKSAVAMAQSGQKAAG